MNPLFRLMTQKTTMDDEVATGRSSSTDYADYGFSANGARYNSQGQATKERRPWTAWDLSANGARYDSQGQATKERRPWILISPRLKP